MANVQRPERLLAMAASGMQKKLATSPKTPHLTIQPAQYITATFATSPPTENRPNACAVIGTPATHAAKDMPRQPSSFWTFEPGLAIGAKPRDHSTQSTIPNITVQVEAEYAAKEERA